MISIEMRRGRVRIATLSQWSRERQHWLGIHALACANVNAFATFMCFLSRGERDRWQILLWSISAGSLFTCLWYHFAVLIGKSRERGRIVRGREMGKLRERGRGATNADAGTNPRFICAMRFRASTSARVITNTRFSHLSPPNEPFDQLTVMLQYV